MTFCQSPTKLGDVVKQAEAEDGVKGSVRELRVQQVQSTELQARPPERLLGECQAVLKKVRRDVASRPGPVEQTFQQGATPCAQFQDLFAIEQFRPVAPAAGQSHEFIDEFSRRRPVRAWRVVVISALRVFIEALN